MHDGTLQIKMCTISHKSRAVFLPITYFILKIQTDAQHFKMYMSRSTKEVAVSWRGKPKAKALRHFKVEDV